VSVGVVWKRFIFVFEVCPVASKYSPEGQSADDGGDDRDRLPFRAGGPDYSAHTEARAEVRDRETYYAELRFAVHCQNRPDSAHPSIPAPRAAVSDPGSDTWTHQATETSPDGTSPDNDSPDGMSGTEVESWDEMIARFGDTWT
jgi:hypothetical protein